jgi:copper(I)-binding protein
MFVLAACSRSSGDTIQVEDAWVRAAQMMGQEPAQGEMDHMSGSNSAAYMLIKNNGADPDRLLSAGSDAAHAIELHESREVDGVMQMEPISAVEVPANASAELKPGGMHIMLIGLTKDLNAGDKVRLVLKFEKAGDVTVDAEVRAP